MRLVRVVIGCSRNSRDFSIRLVVFVACPIAASVLGNLRCLMFSLGGRAQNEAVKCEMNVMLFKYLYQNEAACSVVEAKQNA